MIVLSIVNSIIIAVALKIIELLSNIRRVGKIISSIFLMGLLIFYYYLILSIVSGQDYSESNKAMTSYLIVFVTDLLVVALIISIIFRYLAVYVLRYWGRIKYWKELFDFLRLQLILNEVMKHWKILRFSLKICHFSFLVFIVEIFVCSITFWNPVMVNILLINHII